MNDHVRWSDEMREAWENAPDTHRFQYRSNRIVFALLLGQLGILWALFSYTAWSVHSWDINLSAFSLVYGIYSAFIVIQVMRWRTFVLLSGVVFSGSTLYWSTGSSEYRAKRARLDPEKMGLTHTETWNRFEASLQVQTVDGKEEKLFLYRPFAYMDNLEGFMEKVLEKLDSKRRKVRKK